MEQVSGWSEQGGSVVTVPGTQGSGAQRFQQSFRGATVTVRDSSNNLATIYSDDLASPTAKANPFTASSTSGAWNFFTTTGTYTLTFSGGSILAPFSITVNVGLGNAGGVPSYAFASLPTSKTQNAGDLARVTNLAGSLWMDSGSQWFQIYPVINAAEMSGANAGAKIIAALARLPATGGTVDARGFEGAQTISSNITLSANQHLLLGAATFTLSAATIILSGTGASIQGLPGPCAVNSSGTNTTLLRASGTTTMITAGDGATFPNGIYIADLSINGGGTAGHGIHVDDTYNFRIERVQVGNGGASNALRLTGNVWDFWIKDSTFYVWGSSSVPTINLLAGADTITDGHWYANQIGEVGNGNILMTADGNVVQQRFVDNKFHTTGGAMPYMIDWTGYRSDFIACTFQADTASSTGGLIRIRNSENRFIGGEINDLNNGDGIKLYAGAFGQCTIVGMSFYGTSTSAAIETDASWSGLLMVASCTFSGITTAQNFAAGSGSLSIGQSVFSGVTNKLLTVSTNTFEPINTGYPYVYTPTLTAVANIASSTPHPSQYSRNGNVVTVSGFLDATCTAAANTLTQIRISLPIASNIGNAYECCGAGAGSLVSEPAPLYGDAANNACIMEWLSTTTGGHSMVYQFTYQIV